MDENNPVMKLLIEGMEAEMKGKMPDACALFQQAWAARQDDYEACMAAHFLARHQDSPQATLQWNQEALNRAKSAGDDRVQSFYASLYLNLGYSYETLGNQVEARAYYQMAANGLDHVPEGPYKEVVRDGITRGLRRVDCIDDCDDQRFVWSR